MTMAPVVKRLTAPAHRGAEATVARMAPFEDRGAYVRYLQRLHALYGAIEPGLYARLRPVVADAAARPKLALLERDLAFLGAPPKAASGVFVPDWRSDARAMGVAYVLEGKTLGSRFLLAEARARLGLDVDAGASFFAGYGERTGAMWRSYRDALEHFVARRGGRATIVVGARAMFACFVRTMEGVAWGPLNASAKASGP